MGSDGRRRTRPPFRRPLPHNNTLFPPTVGEWVGGRPAAVVVAAAACMENGFRGEGEGGSSVGSGPKTTGEEE